MRSSSLLQRLQNAPGLDRHRVVHSVHLDHLVHARDVEDQLGAGFIRRAAADEAGVAALRDDWRFGFDAKLDDGSDFFGIGRFDHHQRLAEIFFPPVVGVGREVAGDDVGVTDNRTQSLD